MTLLEHPRDWLLLIRTELTLKRSRLTNTKSFPPKSRLGFEFDVDMINNNDPSMHKQMQMSIVCSG